jgi:phosphatidylserine decarboxylase
MTQTIRDFLARDDIKQIQEHTMGEVMEQDFFRDPLRTVIINKDLFYAPADGIVLYAKEVDADEQYNVKGDDFTVKDMLADPEAKGKFLVVGVFMSWLDVHVNRVPAGVYYLDVRRTPAIQTHGVSMLMAENDLLEDFNIKKEDMEFLRYNEKCVSIFYCPAIKGRFYCVQVADKDIDSCLQFLRGQFLTQGDRFGQIRHGSQCDVIIPLKKGMKYETLVKPLDHVEAGLDAVIKIVRDKGETK